MRFLGKRLMHIRISENTVLKLAALLLLLGSGCQSPKKNPQTLTSRTPSYLVAGDVVRITFPAAPELNQTQKIGSDGTLSLPLIGEAAAAGKTVGQLQEELATRYKPQLQDNEVIVTLDSRAVPVVVSGAVQKPGKIVFERPATVLEAIMEAGGFTPEADLKKGLPHSHRQRRARDSACRPQTALEGQADSRDLLLWRRRHLRTGKAFAFLTTWQKRVSASACGRVSV